jgi:predicted NBD/HSP70 family sugar kinase
VREQSVVDLLRREGPMSRAAIARRCHISKPTASAAVESLLRAGLVVEAGHDVQRNGRPGRLVAFNGGAGYVIGLDLGGTTTRAALADLAGTVLVSEREPTEVGPATALIAQIARLVASLAARATGAGPLLEVAIGTPGVVDRARRRISLAPNLPALERVGFLDDLGRALGLPLTMLNDVNAATIGELAAGAGASVDNLVYVGIGTGLGLGLVFDRRVHHGIGGRAGELGLLPHPPASGRTLEDALSGAGIRRRHAASGGSGAPEDAFAEAAAGREPGRSVIEAFLADLAWTLTLVATLIDPDRIVLGGGIGMRCAAELDTIRAAVTRSCGFDVDLVLGSLGDDAGVIGAVASALEPARSVGRLLRGGSMAPTP